MSSKTPTAIEIKAFEGPGEQNCVIGGKTWDVSRLMMLSKDLEVMEIPLEHLCFNTGTYNVSLRQVVMHFNAMKDADLDYPIILSADGDIMDGNHGIMKALANGEKTIKAVRFKVDPVPCSVRE